VKPSDKEAFNAAAERCGLDPSAAARALLELVVQRVEDGGDMIDALHELKTVWKVPRQAHIEQRLTEEGLAPVLGNDKV
jgi:hypothetical protein